MVKFGVFVCQIALFDTQITPNLPNFGLIQHKLPYLTHKLHQITPILVYFNTKWPI